MSKHPDYVVIRRAPDLPVAFNIGELEGKWFNKAEMYPHGKSSLVEYDDSPGAVAVPTGRFEVRDDGAVAEVYEVRV